MLIVTYIRFTRLRFYIGFGPKCKCSSDHWELFFSKDLPWNNKISWYTLSLNMWTCLHPTILPVQYKWVLILGINYIIIYLWYLSILGINYVIICACFKVIGRLFSVVHIVHVCLLLNLILEWSLHYFLIDAAKYYCLSLTDLYAIVWYKKKKKE